MRRTDYGMVSGWQERNLLAKIDRELEQQAKQKIKDKHKQQLKQYKSDVSDLIKQ
ncbi:hypothetical protein [Loigolactobacillus rennini]|uniref:Uncharacterized protein n=1 Tax=Loigolactobacillus rennini DSM 20253 TaxID=1423796 RepID=A0A0R2D3V8_9LACO|nr:hypothetical protein [Loigolactobacillus rennini]KRM95273.1 hypothetical protein FC24_GL002169 [Loigolactobacillus rennini DSM 20253]